jgi:homoserine kinase type II
MDLQDDIRLVLRLYDTSLDPARFVFLGGAGGLSGARFWRLESPEQPLVLRRWPLEQPTPRQLWFIHSVLAHVAARGFTLVPLPLASQQRGTFVFHAGYLWQLEPWLAGRGDYATHPSRQRLAAALTTLARFHQAASDFPRRDPAISLSHGLLKRLERIERWRSGELARLRGQIDMTYEPALAAMAMDSCELARRSIGRLAEEVAPLANLKVPVQPCIGDIWHDNVLFDGDNVSGLVDFGAMCVDTVARDIARLLGGMADDDREAWDAGLVAYEAIRPLDDDERRLVTTFDRCNIVLSGLNWATWIYEERREFEDRAAVLARMRHFVTRLSR